MNWERNKTNKRLRQETSYYAQHPKITEEIAADPVFWTAWRHDKQAMKDLGYIVRKIEGKWRIFLCHE
jgi:hypothetical protein